MTAKNRAIEALGELGFSQYEARAYSALLAGGPMNGHEVARASGIPPSKIYETLARLVEKAAVLISRGEPVRYSARPSSEVLSAVRGKFESAVALAEEGLKGLPEHESGDLIFNLQDRSVVLSHSCRIIDGAKRKLFVTVWDPELVVLGPRLEEASRRGCKVHVAIYGTTKLYGPLVYDLTNCSRSTMERMAGRRLMTLAADDGETIVAEFHPEDAVKAVQTSNPVIALLVAEYVKADVLSRLLIDDMGEERFATLRRRPGTIDKLLKS